MVDCAPCRLQAGDWWDHKLIFSYDHERQINDHLAWGDAVDGDSAIGATGGCSGGAGGELRGGVVIFYRVEAHSIALRNRAVDRGLKLNEYGIYRGKERLAGETEVSVYRELGLPMISPELREDRGEIEAALSEALPKLITIQDIRGDLHAHTHASDGRDSLREMAEAARAVGYEYLAITDHTHTLTVAHGLDESRLTAQMKEIDRINDELEGIWILKSAEVDILADGSLDHPDGILKELDIVICSIHSRFKFTGDQQTERLIGRWTIRI